MPEHSESATNLNGLHYFTRSWVKTSAD